MLKYSYAYDNLNQLVRENNAVANKTYVYTYDDAGNILTKKTYAYTTGTVGTATSTYSYTYGNSSWGDQLTAYRGVSITYDKLGNPLSYYNGSSYTFTWANGRQLARTVKGGVTTSYTYNADGIRTGKTGVEYILNGTKILAEQNGTHSIRYYYDPQGMPVGMNFDGTVYLYEKNLQGDVIGIYTTSGTKVASYTYDAWGNIVSSTYTSGYYNPYYYNPFRYRGYYYDTESGFYYLQSRYYDPATGRFLNADGYINANGDLQGFNMYAYCSNNPVMYVDYTGEEIVTMLLIGVLVGWFAGATIEDICEINSGDIHVELNGDSNNPDEIEIKNSNKIETPWVQFAYSVYLNHFNPDTRQIVKGSSVGLQYEWFLHNIAYVLSGKTNESAQHLNAGKSIFADSHGGFMGNGMKVTYMMWFSPVFVIWDLIANGGY